jgi:alpha-tubulin suppressor-like RCC1 family protein
MLLLDGMRLAPPELHSVVAIRCGYSHIAVLTADGTIQCWGSDNCEQCIVSTSIIAMAASVILM